MKPQAGWMKPDETTGGVDETTWDGGQGPLKAETRGLTLGRLACGLPHLPPRIRELGVWPCTAFLQHCVSASSATSLVGLSGLCR